MSEEENKPRHIVITLPAVIKWEEYQSELDAVKDGKSVLNFKVGNFPQGIEAGKSKCYLVHKGNLLGWMLITGTSEEPFRCSVTGRSWTGKFIQRSFGFNYLKTPVKMTGFQGFRYVDRLNIDPKLLDL